MLLCSCKFSFFPKVILMKLFWQNIMNKVWKFRSSLDWNENNTLIDFKSSEYILYLSNLAQVSALLKLFELALILKYPAFTKFWVTPFSSELKTFLNWWVGWLAEKKANSDGVWTLAVLGKIIILWIQTSIFWVLSIHSCLQIRKLSQTGFGKSFLYIFSSYF